MKDLHEMHTAAAKAMHCKTGSCITDAMLLITKIQKLEERVKNGKAD